MMSCIRMTMFNRSTGTRYWNRIFFTNNIWFRLEFYLCLFINHLRWLKNFDVTIAYIRWFGLNQMKLLLLLLLFLGVVQRVCRSWWIGDIELSWVCRYFSSSFVSTVHQLTVREKRRDADHAALTTTTKPNKKRKLDRLSFLERIGR